MCPANKKQNSIFTLATVHPFICCCESALRVGVASRRCDGGKAEETVGGPSRGELEGVDAKVFAIDIQNTLVLTNFHSIKIDRLNEGTLGILPDPATLPLDPRLR